MKRLNLTLKEWDEVFNPIWYEIGICCGTIRTTDHSLITSLASLNNPIKQIRCLERIEKLEIVKE